jgi:hypothetical protein
MRDLCELERRGVPAVGYTAAIFYEDAHFSTETFGVPEACPVIVPECFSNKTTDEINQMVDDAMPSVVEGLTVDRTPLDDLPRFDRMTLTSAPELVFDGGDLMEAFEAMQAEFIRNGWSDGLPLMAPTRSKVDAMVDASGLSGDHVVGLFAPGFGIGTVRKIAANAVMAGCKPETMPVIMAMMECILEPSIGLRTWAMSTGPQAPMVLVSGPIADEIGMNHGVCALGPGSISACERLDRTGAPVDHDERRAVVSRHHRHGHHRNPEQVLLLRRRERGEDPMGPWRVQQGFGREESTVTVNVPYGMTEFFDFQNSDPELLIETWATLTTQACGTPAAGAWLIKVNAPLEQGYPFHGKFSNMLLMAPDHASVFGNAGWTPADIANAIHRQTTISFRKLMLNQSYDAFRASHPELLWLLDAPETLVSVNPSPDSFEFFVVGASAGRSQFCFGGTNSVTKAIRRP